MHLAVAVLVLLGSFLPVKSGRHSLEYIYTALSKPIHRHGIHEFTAMGLLNDRMIDYYDNDLQKKVSKQDWMEEKLDKDYWDKGTQSRKFKEQWFKVNIGILMDRMRQNDSDVHSLQWRHGCEVEEEQGSVRFIKGFDQYSYDGDDFLAFDDTSTQWIAPNAAAVPTKRKWDGEQILNQYTKGYLEKECVDWLNKFRGYGQKSLVEAKPPVVHVYAKKANTVGNVELTCWATGFLPKDIILNIRKNELVISDGVKSSGVRPNDGNTHQIWKRVEILENHQGSYDCYVEHVSLKKPVINKWDNVCCDCSGFGVSLIIGVAIPAVLVAVILVVLLVLYKKDKICAKTGSNRSDSDLKTIYSPPGSAAAPSTVLPSSNLDPNKKEGSDGSSDSGHSSGGTPSPTGSTQSIGASAGNSSGGTASLPGSSVVNFVSAGTANESAAPLLTKDSTQHMDDGSNSSDSGAGSRKSLSQSSREEVV
ncbi:H-2 class I histocompatibility antigen, Q10 alpha chain-like isoform X2 [Hypomesus transpacificus]|uniref:H-2 class I histocompatibility antigen, Q10 alpha chain-like isoform X2 n=1 Tax=Hypomesus transpacificus TaxID=137520 RepID=UPI001F07AED3|nr:H-2 class I histocompatibility antigen, Q10 alpha chain-like isoform X2 [Hypomesus transpacificus]